MDQLYVGIPATVVAADGTAAVRLDNGWPRSGWAKWNVSVTAQRGVLTVFAGSTPILGPVPITNGGIIAGPVLTIASDQISVRLAGGAVGGTLSGYIRGGAAANADDLDSIVAITASTIGSTQSDPSQLLSGQVGDPFIENLSLQIPNVNLNPNFVEIGATNNTVASPTYNPASDPFILSGFGALLFKAKSNSVSVAGLFAQIIWLDSRGNQISITNVNAMYPYIVSVIAVQSTRCYIVVGNLDTVNHQIQAFSLIPLVQVPNAPDRLLDNPAASFAQLLSVNDTHAIINTTPIGIATPVGTTQVPGAFVWPGRAILAIGSAAGHAVINWNATLQCTDAAGNITPIARMGSGSANPPPIEVQLTTGQPSVTFVNEGAAATNTIIQLIATS